MMQESFGHDTWRSRDPPIEAEAPLIQGRRNVKMAIKCKSVSVTGQRQNQPREAASARIVFALCFLFCVTWSIISLSVDDGQNASLSFGHSSFVVCFCIRRLSRFTFSFSFFFRVSFGFMHMISTYWTRNLVLLWDPYFAPCVWMNEFARERRVESVSKAEGGKPPSKERRGEGERERVVIRARCVHQSATLLCFQLGPRRPC